MTELVNQLIEFLPSVTAVITLIASVVVSIKKFKSLNKDTLTQINNLSSEILYENAEVRKETKELRSAIAVLMYENAELKSELRKLTFKEVPNEQVHKTK